MRRAKRAEQSGGTSAARPTVRVGHSPGGVYGASTASGQSGGASASSPDGDGSGARPGGVRERPDLGSRAGRNPAKDRVAIAGVGLSPYSRDRQGVTPGSLVAEACIAALRDAGLGREDVDGLCGSMVSAQYVQAALGIPEVTWFANPPAVIGNQIVAAVAAVAAGMCETALVYHHAYRLPWASRAAARDPFRRRATLGVADARSGWGTGHVEAGPTRCRRGRRTPPGPGATCTTTATAARRSGYVALNSRTNAAGNPNAVYPRADDDGRLPRRRA